MYVPEEMGGPDIREVPHFGLGWYDWRMCRPGVRVRTASEYYTTMMADRPDGPNTRHRHNWMHRREKEAAHAMNSNGRTHQST